MRGGNRSRSPTTIRTTCILPTRPDGKTIAYEGYDGNDSEIYTIDMRGGSTLKVTDNDSNDSQPDYAPDGKTIAYVG